MEAFCKAKGPGALWYQCVMDPLVLVGAIREPVACCEEVEQQEIHASRTHRNPLQSIVVAASHTDGDHYTLNRTSLSATHRRHRAAPTAPASSFASVG